MEGVNILNIVIVNDRTGYIVLTVFAIVFLCIFGELLKECISNEFVALSIITGIATLAFVLAAVGCIGQAITTESYNKYEVTIDDTVSMSEFYEHYEVKEQRGDIWVVVEKDK